METFLVIFFLGILVLIAEFFIERQINVVRKEGERNRIYYSLNQKITGEKGSVLGLLFELGARMNQLRSLNLSANEAILLHTLLGLCDPKYYREKTV